LFFLRKTHRLQLRMSNEALPDSVHYVVFVVLKSKYRTNPVLRLFLYFDIDCKFAVVMKLAQILLT